MSPGKQWARLWIAVGLVGLLSASCSIFGGREGASGSDGQQAAQTVAVDSQQDPKAQLSPLAEKMVASANEGADDQKRRVQKRNPYFFKEYGVYPDGTDDMKIVLQEQEGVRTPYVADVSLSKQRFATRFHRKRKEAEADTHFLRDTGTETITLEWRGSGWARVGSLFVAEKTEEEVDGDWQPVDEAKERTVQKEEAKAGNWFGRAFSKMTGR